MNTYLADITIQIIVTTHLLRSSSNIQGKGNLETPNNVQSNRTIQPTSGEIYGEKRSKESGSKTTANSKLPDKSENERRKMERQRIPLHRVCGEEIEPKYRREKN